MGSLFPAEYYRAELLKLREEYGPGAIISHYRLRQDVNLANNQSEYLFRFKPQNQEVRLPQIMLESSDRMIGLAAGYGLIAEKTAKPGTGILQTHPNAVRFAGASPEDLGVCWNGTLQAKTNNVTYAEGMHLDHFLSIPETQQRAEDGASTKQWPAIAHSARRQFEGFTVLPSQWVLDGTAKTEIIIRIPTFASIDLDSSVSGEVLKMVFMLDGFLISGADEGGPK